MLIEVRNPATGQAVGAVSLASKDDVRQAVERAAQAQSRWSRLSFDQRARIVRRFHDLILDSRDRILDTIQSETGKTRRDALAELLTVAGTARYYLAHGEAIIADKRRRPALRGFTAAEVVYKPHGVVGLITPWNYPFLLSIGDALPALLAGNAVVIKPSELTPLSAELAQGLIRESGADSDLVAVVHGDGEVGAELIRHVNYVGFTGGTATGRKVAMAASERLIPYSLELGGKNPMIVLEGAPLEEAATGFIAGAFANSGQACISIERVYVQEAIYDRFVERIIGRTQRLKVGWSNGWDTDVGSLISVEHASKVLNRIDAAVAGGAKILAGGRLRRDLGPAFVEPTLISNATDAMPISHEETFGPVVAVYVVKDAEEAIRRANNSHYGLNASVWAKDRRQAGSIARRLETGSVAVNSTLLIYNTFDVPMGGTKRSGIGRRHGEYGILRYTQAQAVVTSTPIRGGYDSVVLNIKSERAAKALVSAVRLWRRIPWVR